MTPRPPHTRDCISLAPHHAPHLGRLNFVARPPHPYPTPSHTLHPRTPRHVPCRLTLRRRGASGTRRAASAALVSADTISSSTISFPAALAGAPRAAPRRPSAAGGLSGGRRRDGGGGSATGMRGAFISLCGGLSGSPCGQALRARRAGSSGGRASPRLLAQHRERVGAHFDDGVGVRTSCRGRRSARGTVAGGERGRLLVREDQRVAAAVAAAVGELAWRHTCTSSRCRRRDAPRASAQRGLVPPAVATSQPSCAASSEHRPLAAAHPVVGLRVGELAPHLAHLLQHRRAKAIAASSSARSPLSGRRRLVATGRRRRGDRGAPRPRRRLPCSPTLAPAAARQRHRRVSHRRHRRVRDAVVAVLVARVVPGVVVAVRRVGAHRRHRRVAVRLLRRDRVRLRPHRRRDWRPRMGDAGRYAVLFSGGAAYAPAPSAPPSARAPRLLADREDLRARLPHPLDRRRGVDRGDAVAIKDLEELEDARAELRRRRRRELAEQLAHQRLPRTATITGTGCASSGTAEARAQILPRAAGGRLALAPRASALAAGERLDGLGRGDRRGHRFWGTIYE